MYTKREKCIFCGCKKLVKHFEKNSIISVASYNVENPDTVYKYIPYNIVYCEQCFAYQTLFLGDLDDIYKINHADGYGKIWDSINKDFSILMKETLDDIDSIVEIGAGSGKLCDNILKYVDTQYTIIDPFYFGSTQNRTILKRFIEDIDLETVQANTIVMSHVFEHFYEPVDVLKKINNNRIKNICLIFPDLETAIQKGTFNVLNTEHTYYVSNSFIVALFNDFGFKLIKQVSYQEHSVFFIFKRSVKNESKSQLCNENAQHMITTYYDTIYEKINKIHNIIMSIDNIHRTNYIWPCSTHTSFLFTFGLNHLLFRGVLDNSEAKINKYVYGYNLLCSSFTEITNNDKDNITIFINGGCFNKELMCQSKDNIKYVFVNEL